VRYRLQYWAAKTLLATVNKDRPPKEPYYRHCLNAVAFACFLPIRVLDRQRVSHFGRFLVTKGLVRDRPLSEIDGESAFAKGSDVRRQVRAKLKLEDAILTWTMSMAFYALGGGCVYSSKTGEERTLRGNAIVHLAQYEPISLLQLQSVVLQGPGKANAIGKAVTCVQAFWFCSQCVARLNGNLAVSLLELNTFAHCISTLLIYVFWWDKPYDVETHIVVESKSLDFGYSMEHNQTPGMPVLVLPYGSEEPERYTISDSNGNRLIEDKLAETMRSIPNHRDSVLQATESKHQIPGTELYISFENPIDIPIPSCCLSYQSGEEYKWQRFWSGWMRDGQPVPAHPLPFRLDCFYSHAAGSPDMDAGLLRRIRLADYRLSMLLVMNLSFIVYGGLHLLAWQYNFNSTAERYLWRISTVIAASSGFVLLILHTADILSDVLSIWPTPRPMWVMCMRAVHVNMRKALTRLPYLLVLVNLAARTFLVIESFIALPNSPRSTYTIPSWTSYLPHI
jgi:hypothetical protein